MLDRVTTPQHLGAQYPCPDPAGQNFVRLWNPGPESEVFILSQPWLWGFLTHFIDSRIHPCTQSLGNCSPCNIGWTPRFRGFAAAMRQRTHGRYVVQATKSVWDHTPDLVRYNGRLEGRQFSIRRKTAAPQSEVQWTYFPGEPVRMDKQAPIDVIDVLSRMWSIDLASLRPGFDGDCTPLLSPYPQCGRTKRRTK